MIQSILYKNRTEVFFWKWKTIGKGFLSKPIPSVLQKSGIIYRFSIKGKKIYNKLYSKSFLKLALKVSKFRKQIFLFSTERKNERNYLYLPLKMGQIKNKTPSFFHLFVIWFKKICFRNLLTFSLYSRWEIYYLSWSFKELCDVAWAWFSNISITLTLAIFYLENHHLHIKVNTVGTKEVVLRKGPLRCEISGFCLLSFCQRDLLNLVRIRYNL